MNYSDQVQISTKQKSVDRMFCSSSNKTNKTYKTEWDKYLQEGCQKTPKISKTTKFTKISQKKDKKKDNVREAQNQLNMEEDDNRLEIIIQKKEKELANLAKIAKIEELDKSINERKKELKIQNETSCCIIM